VGKYCHPWAEVTESSREAAGVLFTVQSGLSLTMNLAKTNAGRPEFCRSARSPSEISFRVLALVNACGGGGGEGREIESQAVEGV
jgi:hypothetical protein